MARRVTVLLTSAGVATALNVLTALRGATGLETRFVAVDRQPLVAAGMLADVFHLVPPVSSPGYFARLLEICRLEGVEFLFPLYSGEIELIAGRRGEFLQAGVHSLLPRPETAALCHDKLAFGRFLADQGLHHARMYAPDEAAALVEAGGRVFVKPRLGSSSSGVAVIGDRQSLDTHLGRNPDSVIQECLVGSEYTVDCLRAGGELFAMVPRRRDMVKDGKSMVGHTVAHPELSGLCSRLLQALDMEGPCNVQVIEDAAGKLRVIEVNARLAAGGLPLAVRAGANIPEMMVKLALGLPVAPVADYRVGLYMFRHLTEVYAVADGEGFAPA